MEETTTAPPPAEEMKRLAEAEIPAALNELGQKHTFVNDVIQWCESSYQTGNKKEVQAQTQEYVVDALQSVAKDVEATSAKLTRFLRLQSDAVDTLAIDVNIIKERLAVAKAANAEKRLEKFRSPAPAPVRAKRLEDLDETEREEFMATAGGATYERDLKKRLATFDDVGACLQKRS